MHIDVKNEVNGQFEIDKNLVFLNINQGPFKQIYGSALGYVPMLINNTYNGINLVKHLSLEDGTFVQKLTYSFDEHGNLEITEENSGGVVRSCHYELTHKF